MAHLLGWIPDTLYNTSISAIATNYIKYKTELGHIQADVLFDVYYQLYKEGQLCNLRNALSNLEIFGRLLKVKCKRYRLHNCFQAIMDSGANIATDLANSYKLHCSFTQYWGKCDSLEKMVEIGFLLCDFLNEAGWYEAAERVIEACMETMNHANSENLTLEAYVRLLYAQTSYCKFDRGDETFNAARQFVANCREKGIRLNLAGLYAEFANFFFSRFKFYEAYKWSTVALKELASCKDPKVAVSVLRHAARACVMRRELKKGAMLIQQAVLFCRKFFGDQHPLTAMTLLNYGYCLINSDSVLHSVKVYQAALDSCLCIFGGQNLLVALAHCDLAFAYYEYEFENENHSNSLKHIDKSMEIMNCLLPNDHILIAAAKRIKGLILVELGLGSQNYEMARRIFLESQELHMCSTIHIQQACGEINLQTAKHYSSLACLFHSMKRFRESRNLHLKAIKIQERLLGPDDLEVALSASHLASLYNYKMKRYKEAEKLYLRSSRIVVKLFGNGSRRLFDDYQGLIWIYQRLNNEGRVNHYVEMVYQWKAARKEKNEREKTTSPLNFQSKLIPCERLFSEFLMLS